MSLPPYGDLGKSSRDVFGKGYHFGLMKLDVKTKTNNGVEFNSTATSNSDNGKVSGNLETKYKFKVRTRTRHNEYIILYLYDCRSMASP